MRDIIIEHDGLQTTVTTAAEMAELAGACFAVAERVPEAEGEAFDWHSWYSAWLASSSSPEVHGAPSYLNVEAADSFEASIPWEQLEQAAVLFSIDGAPLAKTGPIRLYVPNGSSKCLNVKSIVKLKIGYNAASVLEEAAYGFKQTFSTDDLRKKR